MIFIGFTDNYVDKHRPIGALAEGYFSRNRITIIRFSNPNLRSFKIKRDVISVRHLVVLLQLYQLVKIVRNKTFKLVVV